MIILEDKGQQDKRHITKHNFLEEYGIETIRVPLPVGDYCLMNDKIQDVIDRKGGRKTVVGKEMVKLKNGKTVERNIYEYGVELKKLDFVGTYNVSVDTKRNIEEILGNICGSSKEHDRFRDECILAKNSGVKMYVLVENKGCYIKGTQDIFNPTIHNLSELHKWRNPRLFIMKDSNEIIGTWKNGKPRYKKIQAFPQSTKGESLMKACFTMQEKYGVEFLFCTPEEAGKKIIELLGVNVDG